MSFIARRLTAAAPRLGAARAFSTTPHRDVAKITIVGGLARSPEIKATSTGKEVLEYAVGSDDGPRDNRRTSWFRVATFVEDGPRKDYLLSLEKGTVVYVEGEVIMKAYTDGEGKTRSAMSIYQRHLEVLRRNTQSSSHSG